MVEFHCVPVFRRGDKVFLRFPIRPRCRKFRKPFLPQGLRLSWSLSRMTSWRVCSIGWVRVRHRCFRSLGGARGRGKPHPVYRQRGGRRRYCSRFIHKTLSDALRSGASDIHFEFYEHNARIRFRVDGQLREVVQPPIAVRGSLLPGLR